MAETEHAHHDHTSQYVKIWGILLGLLAVSVIGPMAEIPVLTLITAFGIACVKAVIVMKFFMHLDKESKMIWYILSSSVVLMFLFFFGAAADVMNHEGSRWENVAAKAEVKRALAAQESGHGEHGAEAGHEAPAHAEPAGH